MAFQAFSVCMMSLEWLSVTIQCAVAEMFARQWSWGWSLAILL